MKKIFALLISCCCLQQGFTQPTKTNQLLWFKGKLIKPNVLLTSTGDTVFYDAKKREIKRVSKSGTGKKFDNMLAELNKTSKRVDAAVQQILKSVPQPLQPDMIAAVQHAYTDLAEQWKPLLNNTYRLPEDDFRMTPKILNGKGGLHDMLGMEEEDPFEESLKKMRAYIAMHKDDDLGSLLPVPPVYNFSYCFPCDSVAGQRYQQEKEQFLSAIMAADVELHTEALKMCQYIQRKYIDQLDKPENAAIKKQHDEAWAFHELMMERGVKRAVLLLDKYINDPYRLAAVFEFVLKTDRELQLMGVREESALGNRDYWPGVIKTMDDFFMKALNEKDYPIALNIRSILGHERTKQLLGMAKKETDLLSKVIKFNQFKLNSNITAKVSGNGGYVMGHVRGDNWFYAIPDKATCRLNWILARTTGDRTAKYKLLAAEAAPGEYVGTKDWQSQPPVFKMDFCYKEGEEVADTIWANTFHPEGFREKWMFPPPAGLLEVETVSGVLMSSFLDIERMKEEAAALSKGKIEQMKKDLETKYLQSMQNANTNQFNKLSLEMQADLEKMNREIKELLAKANPLKYIFTPQVNNRTTQIIKERLNGKEIFPEHAALEYAWFHLTMEHDPDGPHPMDIYFLSNLINR